MQGISKPPSVSIDVEDDIVLVYLVEEVLSSGKSWCSCPTLVLLQHPLKKGHFENSSKVGRKKDVDKIKSTGDLLVKELQYVKYHLKRWNRLCLVIFGPKKEMCMISLLLLLSRFRIWDS